MITIDGSQGEGGGQILRTSLALSIITRTPVRIERIRAARPKPGLQRQHLAAVLAAARVGAAEVEGAELNSRAITFMPQGVIAGTYHFPIGSAGSASLVLQTVLPALLLADGPSTMVVEGGTHNPLAPPFEFLRDAFVPLLHRIGAGVTVTLDRHGFYPAGGGKLIATIQPLTHAAPLDLRERGRFISRHAVAVIANLPAHVAMREAQAIKHALRWSHDEVDETEVSADGPGNVVVATLRHAQVTEVVTAVGELRKPAERVAGDVARDVRRYLAADMPVGEHLADQLLLPLAIAAGGRFRTLRPSEHATTNAAVIAQFLGERVRFTEQAKDDWLVDVDGADGHVRDLFATHPWRRKASGSFADDPTQPLSDDEWPVDAR